MLWVALNWQSNDHFYAVNQVGSTPVESLRTIAETRDGPARNTTSLTL